MKERGTAADTFIKDLAKAGEAVGAVTEKIRPRLQEVAYHQIVRPVVRRTLQLFRR